MRTFISDLSKSIGDRVQMHFKSDIIMKCHETPRNRRCPSDHVDLHSSITNLFCDGLKLRQSSVALDFAVGINRL